MPEETTPFPADECDCPSCTQARRELNKQKEPKSTARNMKYVYTYEGRQLAIGDKIGGYTIADFSDSLIKVQESLPRSLWCGTLKNWAFATNLGVVVHTLPTTAIFDRITGERIAHPDEYSLDGVILPNGYALHYLDKNNRHVDLCTSSSGCRFEAAYNNSAEHLFKLGIEVRSDMTWDIAERVPRFIHKGVTCIKVSRSFVPATEAVWSRYQKKYIRLECAVAAGSSWVDKSCDDLIQFVDGSYGIRGSGYEITGGPNAGRFVHNRRDRQLCSGLYYPVSELIPVWYDSEDTPHEYMKEPPTGNPYYELINGEWCVAGESVVLMSGERCARHRSFKVYSLTGGQRTAVFTRLADLHDLAEYCDTCCCWALKEFISGCECSICAAGSRTRIRSYNSGEADSLVPEEDIPLKFGIELEVGCDKGFYSDVCTTTMADALSDREDFSKYGVFKHDGSIQCGGFEIVTRPDSPAVHKRIWSKALAVPEVRQRMSSWTNTYCGMHIHVSRAPLSALWIGRILVTVNSPEMAELVTTVAGRGSVRYAQRMDKRLTSGKSRYGDRYEAVNTTGNETIEFRIFRGTLDPRGFIRNIEFVEAVLAFTRPASVSLREVGSLNAFVEFVSKSRKTYPILFEFLTVKGFIVDPRKPQAPTKKTAESIHPE